MTIQTVQKLVGREEQIRDFNYALLSQPKRTPAMLFYGPSGIGKRRLRAELRNIAGARIIADVDLFDPSRARPEFVLSSCREQLERHGVRFPGYTLVHREYMRMFEPGRPFADAAPMVSTPGLAGFAKIAEVVPPVAVVTGAIQGVWELLTEGKKRRLSKQRDLPARIAAAQQNPDALLPLLAEQLAVDVSQFAQAAKRGVVLFLSQFERLRPIDDGTMPLPPWVEALIRNLDGPLLAIFSEVEVDGGGLREKQLRRVKLQFFREPQYEEYLDLAQEKRPEIRAAIQKFAGGLPFGYATAVSIAQKRGASLRPADFRVEGKEADSIYAAFTRAMDREVIDALSVPRLFDRDAAAALLERPSRKPRKNELDKFLRNDFVVVIEKQKQSAWYAVHPLLRDAALDRMRREDAEKLRDMHELLWRHHRRRSGVAKRRTEADWRAVGEAIYHGAAAGIADDYAEWLDEIDRDGRADGRFEWLEASYESALRQETASELAEAMLTLLLGGCRARMRGGGPEAETLVQRGFFEIAKLRRGQPLHGWALISRGESANRDQTSGTAAALQYAEEARTIFAAHRHRRGEALALNNIAYYHGRLGNEPGRLDGYRKVRDVAKTFNLPDSDLYESNYAAAIAGAGDLDVALRLHRDNLESRKRGRASSAAVTRTHIAEILAMKGAFDEALQEQSEALRTFEQEKRAPRVLATKRLEASIRFMKGELEPARAILSEVLQEAQTLESDERVSALFWNARMALAHDLAGAANDIEQGTAFMTTTRNQRYRGELLALQATVEARQGRGAEALTHFRQALAVSFAHISERCAFLREYAKEAAEQKLLEESRAALLQAVALAEVGGLYLYDSSVAALEKAPAVTPGPWPPPDALIEAIDARYHELLRETEIARYETPINREKEAFLLRAAYNADKPYSPRFQYPDPPPYPVPAWTHLFLQLDLSNALHRLYNELVHEQLRAIMRVRTHSPRLITASTAAAYGKPDPELVNAASALIKPSAAGHGALLDAATIRDRVEQRLRQLHLDGWTASLQEPLASRLRADTLEKKILIRSSLAAPSSEVDALVAHEVDVHAVRAASGERQKLSIFASGLPGYLETEEGLGVYAEVAVSGGGIPQRFALRVLAADRALEHSFFETFRVCASGSGDLETSMEVVMRVKRGFVDSSEPGAHLKDIIYLRGALAVRDLLRGATAEDDWRLLFVGKVGLRHLGAVRAAIGDGWLVAPQNVPPQPACRVVIPSGDADHD